MNIQFSRIKNPGKLVAVAILSSCVRYSQRETVHQQARVSSVLKVSLAVLAKNSWISSPRDCGDHIQRLASKIGNFNKTKVRRTAVPA